MQIIRYIDTHSHIHFPDFDSDRKEVSDRMSDMRVGAIAVGTSLETSLQVVKLAKNRGNVWACIGVHPNTNEDFDTINTRVNSGEIDMSKVVAVGECGLDYFRSDGSLAEERERQKKLFKSHIEFSIRHTLPLMLHIRSSNDESGQSTNDAHDDAIEILREHKKEYGDVLRFHCHFTTFGIDMARKFLSVDERATFGIPGVVTYKNAKDLQELVRWLPLEKILCETDAPYAAPVPHRGERNEPVFVISTVSAIADLRGENREVVREQLLENSKRVFNLDVS